MGSKKHSKNYVCPICFNQIQNCTCICPPYTLIMVDNGIQEAVRSLNQKGYITVDSCEGHFENILPNTYISFEQRIETCPVGFNNEGKVIRKIYNCSSKTAFEKEKREALKNLNTWANNLNRKGK